MLSLMINKDNIIAIFLLALIVIFLSSPYLVKADATVDGFFPENFVTKGYFNEEVEKSFVTKSNREKTGIPLENTRGNNENCRQIIKTARDSFSIPAELINCAKITKAQ